MNAAATQLGSADKATTIAVDAMLRSGASRVKGADNASGVAGKDDAELRQIVGEFVGNVFYGTLLRQMEQSNIKGEYMHGGRGEEIFQSQLHMEYAKRLGRAPGDPIADRMYEAMTRGKRQAEARAAKAGGEQGDATATPGSVESK
ncbi:MAG: rod-binding protein [Phycisphaerales bacterium]|nr:rod-binding protein [Phycisphaerales bacterium]